MARPGPHLQPARALRGCPPLTPSWLGRQREGGEEQLLFVCSAAAAQTRLCSTGADYFQLWGCFSTFAQALCQI